MATKPKDQADPRAAIAEHIRENPTASDVQVAAAVEGATADLVSEVRHELGSRADWPKPKKEKS